MTHKRMTILGNRFVVGIGEICTSRNLNTITMIYHSLQPRHLASTFLLTLHTRWITSMMILFF